MKPIPLRWQSTELLVSVGEVWRLSSHYVPTLKNCRNLTSSSENLSGDRT